MQGLRQYWWNLFVNGFLMSYLVPVGFRRFILNFMGANYNWQKVVSSTAIVLLTIMR